MNIINTIANIGILISSICNVVIAFFLYRKTSNSYKLEEKSKEETKEIQNEMKKIQIEMKEMQNEHNVKSVQPIAYIACKQIGNSITVEVRNYGLATMILNEIIVTNKNSVNEKYDALYKVFPSDIRIDNYCIDINGRAIAVDKYITLVDFKNLKEHDISRIRNILGKYTIKIEYKDIYDRIYTKEKMLYDIFCVEHRSQN